MEAACQIYNEVVVSLRLRKHQIPLMARPCSGRRVVCVPNTSNPTRTVDYSLIAGFDMVPWHLFLPAQCLPGLSSADCTIIPFAVFTIYCQHCLVKIFIAYRLEFTGADSPHSTKMLCLCRRVHIDCACAYNF